jgi:excisionase family DNA binding protein
MQTDAGITARKSHFSETLISRRDVAAHLGISESGFVKMIERGEGPAYFRIGRLIRFSPTTVKAWVAAQLEITVPAE